MTDEPQTTRRDSSQRRLPGAAPALVGAALTLLAITSPGAIPSAAATSSAAAISDSEPAPADLPPAYTRLLEDPRLTAGLVWEERRGAVPYGDWSAEQRIDLVRALRAAELRAGRVANGEPGPSSPSIPSAPSTRSTGDLALTQGDAWRVYLDHVANALWLEAEHRVPWSLLSLTPGQLSLLLDGRALFNYQRHASADEDRYTYGPAGAVADPSPVVGLSFVLSEKLLSASQEETVWTIAGWLRERIVYPEAPPRPHEGPRPSRTVAEILAGRGGGTPEVADCHELAGMLVAVFRSVNVPATVGMSRFSLPGLAPSEHSRVDLPTLGRSLADSSVLAMPLLRPSGNVVPTPALFPTLGWIAENLEMPRHLECVEGACHRPSDQALYNTVRRTVDLAVSHLPDGLLTMRIDDAGPEAAAPALEALLSGRLDTWQGRTFLVPFFDEEERREILRRVDEEIARIGDGDWHLGAERVRRRWLASRSAR